MTFLVTPLILVAFVVAVVWITMASITAFLAITRLYKRPRGHKKGPPL